MSSKHLPAKHVFALLIIASCITVTYGPQLKAALLMGDDLLTIALARAQGPFIGWGSSPELMALFGSKFYRPLFLMKGWLYYRLFGLNYAGYHAMEMLQIVLAMALFYSLLYRLTGRAALSLVGTLLYSTHPFAARGSTYAVDASEIAMMLMPLVLLTIMQPVRSLAGHVGLTALLLLAPLARESGMVIPGAVVGYAFAGFLLDGHLKRRNVLLAVDGSLAVLGYLLLRWRGLGTITSAGRFGSDVVRSPASNVATHLTAYFFPIFTDDGWILGKLNVPFVLLIGLAFVSLFAAIFVIRRRLWRASSRKTLVTELQRIVDTGVSPVAARYRQHILIFSLVSGAAAVLVALAAFHFAPLLRPINGGLLLLYAGVITLLTIRVRARSGPPEAAMRRQIVLSVTVLAGVILLKMLGVVIAQWPLWNVKPTSIIVPFSFHIMLTLCIALALLGWPRWPARHRQVTAYAASLMLFGSILGYPYFRYRMLFLGMMGWILIGALAYHHLSLGGLQRQVRAAMAVLSVTIILINGYQLRQGLPTITAAGFIPGGSYLCAGEIPDDMALDIARRYGIDTQMILDCRASLN